MPADSPRNAITRQWELLKHLPSSAPGKSAAELTRVLADAGYMVTKRTVERDLEALEALFPITHGESAPFDWHWVKGGAFGVMGLSTSDALSLNLLQRFLKPILPAAMTRQLEPTFALAERKLATIEHSNPLGRWPQKVAAVDASLPVVPPTIHPAALQTVQEALLAEEQLAVQYVNARGEAKTQTLHPLGLVQCGSITYLIATAFKDAKVRLYAMHRMESAKRLHEPARIPDGFTLKAFIDAGGMQLGDGPTIRLKAWVSSELGKQLADTRLTENQRLEPVANGFIFTATLPDSWRLSWWILSKTGSIEVLAPKELRQNIGARIQTAATRYVTP